MAQPLQTPAKVRRLSAALGAEITGLNLAQADSKLVDQVKGLLA
jgi:hypothetical protein